MIEQNQNWGSIYLVGDGVYPLYVWLWDIIYDKTHHILASRISRKYTTKDAEMLMDKANKKAGKSPKVVITDKLASYLDVTQWQRRRAQTRRTI